MIPTIGERGGQWKWGKPTTRESEGNIDNGADPELSNKYGWGHLLNTFSDIHDPTERSGS